VLEQLFSLAFPQCPIIQRQQYQVFRFAVRRHAGFVQSSDRVPEMPGQAESFTAIGAFAEVAPEKEPLALVKSSQKEAVDQFPEGFAATFCHGWSPCR
jgi:hypothetical protein